MAALGVIGIDGCVAECGRREGLFDFCKQLLVEPAELPPNLFETCIHAGAELVQPVLGHGDLDPRLVLVVAPSQHVVDADDGFEIGQQIGLGQEVANDLADHRRPAQAAADDHLEPGLAGVVAHHAQADVVGLGHGTVVGRAGDGHLELPRQELELRMVGGPLADQLGHRARVGDFVCRGTGEMVGGDVADRVAAGLQGVHFHVGKRFEDIRHIGQLGPVVLDVLARGEMAVALVPAVGDHGQLTHLAGCSSVP